MSDRADLSGRIEQDPFERKIESRAGDMVIRYPVDERRRLCITLSEREFNVAQYCGLLFHHPFRDGFIYLGPWQDVGETADIVRCTVTKNTEADIRCTPGVVYTHDEHADIEFRIEDHE